MKKTGPPAVDLTDVEAAKKFSEKDEVVLIGFFKDQTSTDALAFLSVAEVQDSLAFGITSSQEVADALEASFDSIVLYKKVSSRTLGQYFTFTAPPPLLPLLSLIQFDDGRVVYDGEFIAEDIESFVIQEQLPLVTVFSDEVGVVFLSHDHMYNHMTHTLQTAPKIFGGSIRSHLLAFFSSEAEDAETTTEQLRTTAKQFKGQVSGYEWAHCLCGAVCVCLVAEDVGISSSSSHSYLSLSHTSSFLSSSSLSLPFSIPSLSSPPSPPLPLLPP